MLKPYMAKASRTDYENLLQLCDALAQNRFLEKALEAGRSYL